MPTESQSPWQPPAIAPLDQALKAAMRARIDGKAKPPGSLGRIEDLAVQLGMIAHPADPRSDQAVLLVFAGDHGLTAEGVSQYPSAVTVAMVKTYLAGRASANAFAAASDVRIRVVDAGVAAELPAHPNLIDAKIRMGTANAAREPAMSMQQACDALAKGCALVMAEIDAGADIIATGEMGIGNTASSALLVHRLAPAPLDDCIGIGAGQDDQGMARKHAAIARAAARSDASSPLDVLREFGGLEIAMMAGAVLGAASRRRPVVIDGFISSAAALRGDPARSGGPRLLRVRAPLGGKGPRHRAGRARRKTVARSRAAARRRHRRFARGTAAACRGAAIDRRRRSQRRAGREYLR